MTLEAGIQVAYKWKDKVKPMKAKKVIYYGLLLGQNYQQNILLSAIKSTKGTIPPVHCAALLNSVAW